MQPGSYLTLDRRPRKRKGEITTFIEDDISKWHYDIFSLLKLILSLIGKIMSLEHFLVMVVRENYALGLDQGIK